MYTFEFKDVEVDDCTPTWDQGSGVLTLDMLVLFTVTRCFETGRETVVTGVGAVVDLFDRTPIHVEVTAVEDDEDFPMPSWLNNHPALKAAMVKAAIAQEEVEMDNAADAYERMMERGR